MGPSAWIAAAMGPTCCLHAASNAASIFSSGQLPLPIESKASLTSAVSWASVRGSMVSTVTGTFESTTFAMTSQISPVATVGDYRLDKPINPNRNVSLSGECQ